MRNLPYLTSLRFFAAAFVVAHHFLLPERRPVALDRFDGDLLGNFLNSGFLAVPFFFVLSGFIMDYTYANRPMDPGFHKSYYVNRIARIYPVYLLWLLPEAKGALVGVKAAGMGTVAAYALTKVTMTHTWSPIFMRGWNDPTWSLCSEALFYLLFPLVLPLAVRIPKRRVPIFVGSTFLVAFVVQAFLHADNPVPDAMRFLVRHPVLRLPEFAFGIALAQAYRHGLCDWARGRWVLWGAAVLVVLGAALGRAAPLALTSLVLLPMGVVVLSGAFQQGGFLASPFALLLGEASYGLYLLHAPLHWIVERHGPHALDPTADALHFLAFFVVAVSLSIAVHKLFELPARNLIRRTVAQPPKRDARPA